MLDELLEYEQYISVSPDEDCRRLKYSTLLNLSKDNISFAGLERALTIVARGYIFRHDDAADFDEERERDAKEALKAYCGFPHDDAPDTEELEDKLPQYLRQGFLTDALAELGDSPIAEGLTADTPTEDLRRAQERIAVAATTAKKDKSADYRGLNLLHLAVCAIVELADKKGQFARGLYGGYSTKNDFKLISFARILADAYNAGKLRRRRMACDANPFAKGFAAKFTAKDNLTPNSAGKKINTANDRDFLLKMTAAYLLAKNDGEFAEINQTDVANWLIKKDQKFEADTINKYRMANTREEIFAMQKISGSVKKYRLNPEWAKHFWLVEDGDEPTKDKRRAKILYEDCGSGAGLLVTEL